MSSDPAGIPSPEEPLAQRVLRQARTGQLDEDRLLPGQDKRERDLTKKLDKLVARAGWYTFVSAQAHAIATGKAPARRNAEIMVVQEVTRWRREVERFTPARLEEVRGGHPPRAGTSRAPAAPRGPVVNVQVRPRLTTADDRLRDCTEARLRLIPHHQDGSHGRPEYRSPGRDLAGGSDAPTRPQRERTGALGGSRAPRGPRPLPRASRRGPRAVR